jgi:hypothetical protein
MLLEFVFGLYDCRSHFRTLRPWKVDLELYAAEVNSVLDSEREASC